MSLRAVARELRNRYKRVQFRAWTLRARIDVARNGGRLVVEAPHGAWLDGSPTIKGSPEGSGSGVFTIRVGRNVKIGRGLVIDLWARADNLLEIGDGTVFLNNVRVALRGGSARIGRACLIRDGVWIKVDGDLRIGFSSTLSHHAAVHCTGEIVIEDHVGLGERVSVVDSDHEFSGDEVPYMAKPVAVTPVRIGRNSMVAINAVVLRGARIGESSVVAANSVVRGGDYAGASLIAGNPARVVKDLARTGNERA